MIDTSVVEAALGAAAARGAQFAEVFVEDRSSTSAMLDDGRVEELLSGRDRGAGVRVVVGDTTGFAHTSDLSEGGLRTAAEAAAAVARDGGGAVRNVSLGGGGVTTRDRGNALSQVSKEAKVLLLQRADAAARAAGDKVRQVRAGYGDSRRQILVANSEGLLSSDDQVRARLMVSVVASGDTGLQTGYHVKAANGDFDPMGEEVAEDTANEAARIALVKLEARPAPSGLMPVILKGGSGGVLFHEACGHGLEADHIVKEVSVYAGRLGSAVASPLVTLVDDGTLANEWGMMSIDDEGRPASRNVLIENGVLVGYMSDFLRARKEGRSSSSNGRRQSYAHLPMVRMTNTFLTPGEDDPDDIVAGTQQGIYVAKLGGGQVNTATGDFVFGTTEAYLIEDGRITAPLRDANLIGNGPDVLSRIDAVAADFDMIPGTCGKDGQAVPVGCGQPTLRVSGMTVGGTAGA